MDSLRTIDTLIQLRELKNSEIIEIFNKVNTYNQNEFGNLLTLVYIALALLGVILPIIIIAWDFYRSKKRDEELSTVRVELKAYKDEYEKILNELNSTKKELTSIKDEAEKNNYITSIIFDFNKSEQLFKEKPFEVMNIALDVLTNMKKLNEDLFSTMISSYNLLFHRGYGGFGSNKNPEYEKYLEYKNDFESKLDKLGTDLEEKYKKEYNLVKDYITKQLFILKEGYENTK